MSFAVRVTFTSALVQPAGIPFATVVGAVVSGGAVGTWSRTEMVPDGWFGVTMSGSPSPFRSAAMSPHGLVPTGYWSAAPNPPAPSPSATNTMLSV